MNSMERLRELFEGQRREMANYRMMLYSRMAVYAVPFEHKAEMQPFYNQAMNIMGTIYKCKLTERSLSEVAYVVHRFQQCVPFLLDQIGEADYMARHPEEFTKLPGVDEYCPLLRVNVIFITESLQEDDTETEEESN